MSAIIARLRNEPALVVGTAVTILLNAVATLNGAGFLSDISAGRITDIVNGAASLITALLPLITAVLIRPQVYGPGTVAAIRGER